MKKYFYYLAIGLVSTAAAWIFFVTLYHALFVGSSDPALLPPASGAQKTEVTPATAPARLFIPTLSIDATIEPVGVTKAGAIGAPSNFTNVAWYEYSPLPGHNGTAVIDGHLNNGLGLPGVFAHLSQLQPGDTIYVINASGERVRFQVSEKERLPSDTKDTSDIFKPTSGASLVLITCSGDWDAATKQYSDRMLVFAVRVN